LRVVGEKMRVKVEPEDLLEGLLAYLLVFRVCDSGFEGCW
jgi:hypothetical protein